MTFTESIKTCLRKYIDFNGRASRPEYWWFVLLSIVLSFIPVIGWLIRLALLLPSLSVQARRLHDMNRSAWWLLLLVPPITIIGGIILLVMSASRTGPKYGSRPCSWAWGNSGVIRHYERSPIGPSYGDPTTRGRPTFSPMPRGKVDSTVPSAALRCRKESASAANAGRASDTLAV